MVRKRPKFHWLSLPLFLGLTASCASEGSYSLHLILPDESAEEYVARLVVSVLEPNGSGCAKLLSGELDPEELQLRSSVELQTPFTGTSRLRTVPLGSHLFFAEGLPPQEETADIVYLRGCEEVQIKAGKTQEVTILLEWACDPELGDEGHPDEPECSNGRDDDCDGLSDAEDPDCESCISGDSRGCGSDEGECEMGTQFCNNGKWSECLDDNEPATEICDGLDNNCDGETDEIAETEVCDDGVDNDCDGLTDDIDLDDCLAINYRSVGTETGVLFEAGTASVTDDTNIVEFDQTLPSPDAIGAVGPGDVLTLDPGGGDEEIHHVLRVESGQRLILQEPALYEHVNSPFTIRRAYNNLQDWEDDRQGDLVAEKRREVAVCYKDGLLVPVDNEFVRIQDSVTDELHFMEITVAQGQRHLGVQDTGVVIDGEFSSKYAFLPYDAHTRISWLEINRFCSEDGSAAIRIMGPDVTVENLLIHTYYDGSSACSGITLDVNHSGARIRNCVLYNGRDGIRGSDPGTATVQNCTIYGMSNDGINENDSQVEATNTIVVGSSGQDFDMPNGTQDHNMSSDDTASGEGSLIDMDPALQFQSLDSDAEDFHLVEGSQAIDAGRDLSEFFLEDIDGQTRPLGADSWDLGADERF